MIAIFLACIVVPALIVGIAALIVRADEYDCPCSWCDEQRERDQHPAGRGL